MDRRSCFLGLSGGLATAPAIIAGASSVEAAPMPEAAAPSLLTEADLEALQPDWAQSVVDMPGSTWREKSRANRTAWSEESPAEGGACDAPPGVTEQTIISSIIREW